MARIKTVPRFGGFLIEIRRQPRLNDSSCEITDPDSSCDSTRSVNNYEESERDDLVYYSREDFLFEFAKYSRRRERARIAWIQSFENELRQIRQELQAVEEALRVKRRPHKQSDKNTK